MNTDQIYVGHAAQVLADFPDGCIDMIATSPLYWQSDDGSSRWLSLLICNRRGTSVPVYSDQTARLRIFDFNGAASQMRNCVTAITATPRAVSQCGRTDDWMVRAGFMEKIMRKTDHTSNFGHGTFEDRTLDDKELDAVTGGIYTDASHWVPTASRDEMILTGLLQAANHLSR